MSNKGQVFFVIDDKSMASFEQRYLSMLEENLKGNELLRMQKLKR